MAGLFNLPNIPLKSSQGFVYGSNVIVEGNIGIGTTTPIAPFHTFANSAGPGIIVNQQGTGTIADFRDAGVQKILFDANGNIGIGTTIVTEAIRVEGNVALSGGVGVNRYIGTTTNGGLNLRTNGVDRVTILSGGNVGIGYASPDRKLWVEGTSIFRNMNINPDQNINHHYYQVTTTAGNITQFRLNRLGLYEISNYATAAADHVYVYGHDTYVLNGDASSSAYGHALAAVRGTCINRAGSLAVAASLRRVNYAEAVSGLFQNELNANTNTARGVYGRVFNYNGDYITNANGLRAEVDNLNDTNTATNKEISYATGVSVFVENRTRSDRTAGTSTMIDANGVVVDIYSTHPGATISNAFLYKGNIQENNSGVITNKWGLYLTGTDKHWLTGNATFKQRAALTSLTFSTVNNNSQLALRGFAEDADGLFMGNFGDSIGNNPVGYIQYQWDGNSGRPLSINPLGGSVGIGTTLVGNARLRVMNTDTSDNIILQRPDSANFWRIGVESPTDVLHIFNNGSSGVYMTYGGTSWVSYSDIRLKKNIETIESAIATLNKIRPIKFNWNHELESANKSFGVIANDVQEVLPELTHSTIGEDGNPVLGVKYTELIPVLIKAIQEMDIEIKLLKTMLSQK